MNKILNKTQSQFFYFILDIYNSLVMWDWEAKQLLANKFRKNVFNKPYCFLLKWNRNILLDFLPKLTDYTHLQSSVKILNNSDKFSLGKSVLTLAANNNICNFSESTRDFQSYQPYMMWYSPYQFWGSENKNSLQISLHVY